MLSRILNALVDSPSLSLENLSKQLGISRKRIQFLVKTSTGKQFREVRETCRLCRSVKRLSSGCSVKESALECGYVWPGNYTRALKKHIGVSPSLVLKEQMGGMQTQATFPVLCPFNVNICQKNNYTDSEKHI